jgi:CrcB protein
MHRQQGVGTVSHQRFVFLLIFVGGGIGSMLRHAVNQTTAAVLGVNFPYGTLLVNIIGSFIVGLLAGWFALRGGNSQSLRLFLTTGIVGGFTTFSAFTLDTALLWERGQLGVAALYALGTIAAGLISLCAGLAIMRTALSL